MKGKDTYAGQLFRLLKWVIGLLFCWYVYQVVQTEGAPWPEEGMGQFLTRSKGMLLLLVLLLIPLNLLIEWVKWQMLLKERIPLWWGIRAICTGMMAGLVSISGFGDFAGRVLYLPAHQRVKGSWAAIASGVINFWTILLCALPIFTHVAVAKGMQLEGTTLLLAKLSSWLLVLVLLLLYMRAKHLPLLFSRIKLLKGWRASFEALGNYSRPVMTSVLALSVLKFLTYNAQLNLLWQVSGLQLGFLEGFIWSTGLYGILSLVPNFLITDLGVRGGVALWLLSDFAAFSWQILLPVYVIWLLNVIIPAMFGWLSMWFLNRQPPELSQ